MTSEWQTVTLKKIGDLWRAYDSHGRCIASDACVHNCKEKARLYLTNSGQRVNVFLRT